MVCAACGRATEDPIPDLEHLVKASGAEESPDVSGG